MGAINRNADNWRPLFAIADLVGADWPQRIREAAALLMPRESESVGPMLLADIRAGFDEKNTDRLASGELCEVLGVMEGRPWAEWKAGKPLTPNQLARLLKSFGVAPETMRVGSRTAKGYLRHQFGDAWERYLAAEGLFEPSQRNKCDEIRTSATFQSVTPEDDVTDQKCEKPNNDAHQALVPGGDVLDQQRVDGLHGRLGLV